MYFFSTETFGYDFIVRKRVLRRFWGVIGAHLKSAEAAF